MKENIFSLETINSEFWKLAILIHLEPSSAWSGPGAIWIVTTEPRTYFISFEARPELEYNLKALLPLVTRKRRSGGYSYVMESEGWTYVMGENTLVRNDVYEDFMRIYRDIDTRKRNLGPMYWDFTPAMAGVALGGNGLPERYNEEQSMQLVKKMEEERTARKEHRK